MAQCLVPSWIKTNMWQITCIFLPSYSSSIWLSIFTFSKYCNCFRQILYDYFQDCHHITCTNAFEGQAWKQACLCLSLDYLLWSTIKPVNNILVKSWNTLIDWLIDTAICAKYSTISEKRHTPRKRSPWPPKKMKMRSQKKSFIESTMAWIFCKKPGPICYILASGASFLIYTPPIGGHHPVLFFPSQIQRNIVQRCAIPLHTW